MAKMTLEDLVSQLRGAFAKDLRAGVLYGSAAAGDYNPKKSDYNVLVLVDSLATNRLMAASAAVKAWSDSGNPPPLTLTMDEWHGSADIFPMEYADVLERHRVLFGDLVMDIAVNPQHLRLQLEHEAMGTLLQLRRGAMAAADGQRGAESEGRDGGGHRRDALRPGDLAQTWRDAYSSRGCPPCARRISGRDAAAGALPGSVPWPEGVNLAESEGVVCSHSH